MSIDSSWTEPKSDYKAVYPYNNIKQTESGHFFEMDDTPGAERVRLQHRTGTFTEVQANGQRINKVKGDNYELIIGNDYVYIKGQCNITVEGACVINVKGDAFTVVEGNAKMQVKGDCNQLVEGTTNISSKGDINVATSGDINLQASAVNINADLNVNGGITSSQTVSALGNVTAGMNLSADLSVQTPGFVTAGVAVNSPIINDYIGTLESVRIGVNAHLHSGVKSGPDISGTITSPIT